MTTSKGRAPNQTLRTAKERGQRSAKEVARSKHAQRKLHIGHFAFMRALVQGLDLRTSWERYLRTDGESNDLARINRTVAWIRDEFAAAAKRHDRYGTARLVKIDPRLVKEQATALPTLEEFIDEEALHDFSEKEQLEVYQDRYGAVTQRQSRRTRLIAKQLDALHWLEHLVIQPPQLDDQVSVWLHPDLANRLEAASIMTLRQLIDRINGRGQRWWTGIRAIGATKATRIQHWMHLHEASIGRAIGMHVGMPLTHVPAQELERIVPRATAIVPLDKLIVPAELSGAQGLHRVPANLCRIAATTDLEAVHAWLNSKKGRSTGEQGSKPTEQQASMQSGKGRGALSHTQRAYRKEAERFMLWTIVQHRTPLSSIMQDDCKAYYKFLTDPQPADRWCGPRNGERWGPLWRPFEGPLSLRAQHHAIKILKSLYSYLVDQQYLKTNPWAEIDIPKTKPSVNTGPYFTLEQWRLLERQLDQLPDTSANQRLQIALPMLHGSGLRLSEIVGARAGHLYRMRKKADGTDNGAGNWYLKVNGRTGKGRVVVVSDTLIAKIFSYLSSRGLPSDPMHEANHQAYLLGKAVDIASRASWSPRSQLTVMPAEGIAAGTLYAQIKKFLINCAAVQARADTEAARRLTAASIDWLRYSKEGQVDSVSSIDSGQKHLETT